MSANKNQNLKLFPEYQPEVIELVNEKYKLGGGGK